MTAPTEASNDSATPRDPHRAGCPIAAAGLGLGLFLAACAPFLRRGWLLLLDWPPGPRPAISDAVFGLPGTTTAGAPAHLFLLGAQALVGAAIGWLPLLAIVAGPVGVAWLVGGRPARWVPAAVLFVWNPFVYERLAAGQLWFLLGYFLLPAAVGVVLAGARSTRAVPIVLMTSLLVAWTVHLVWILGVAIVVSGLVVFGPSRWRSLAWWWARIGLGVVALNVYIWLPQLAVRAPRVGSSDLFAYRSAADPTFGVLGNLIGLYGFWRVGELPLAKESVGGWLLFLAAILLVVAIGFWCGRRAGERERQVLVVCGGAGVIGLVLAMGDLGPTGSLYSFAFDQVPGFAVMREPQKFLALLALAYAVAFGFGVEWLVSRLSAGRAIRTALLVGLVLLPVLYTPNLWWGLGGSVRPVAYPRSWYEAQRRMGGGGGRLLFLPWHQYMSFPFTGRVIATPAANFFGRPVISGDNVELPNLRSSSVNPRSAYLEDLYARGPRLCGFGAALTPLGVEYVAVAHTVDFRRFDWLAGQPDLVEVLDGDDLTLYRNTRYRGIAYWTEADAGGPDPVTERAEGEACPSGAAPPGPPPTRVAASPVAVEVPEGSGRLMVTEPWAPGWWLGAQRPKANPAGTMAFEGPARAGTVRYRPWRVVRAGYGISGTLALLGVAVELLRVYRSRRRPPSADRR